jgi:hypothetical protein
MDASIWGPHFWFVLHTIAHSYPKYPNSITKRKYYDFIQNLPLFLPDDEMGEKFEKILDKYPVTPYLDNRDSFVRWTYFIHNKINHLLGKEEIGYIQCHEEFWRMYESPDIILSKYTKINQHVIVGGCIAVVIALYMMHKVDI